MQMTTKSLLRPLPIAGISGIVLVATFATKSTRSITTTTTMSSNSWPTRPYTPKHQAWPYNPSDFTRQDSSADSSFYSAPRFVTHIDDAAIATLREYYDTVLPRKGRILDFCSSWVSHYPPAVEEAAKKGEVSVMGMGMNEKELEANPVLNSGRILQDLNSDPDVSKVIINKSTTSSATVDEEESKLDASTNVVSTDYLTRPVEVLKSLREATKVGGKVHLTISNRCFPTKAISRWLRVGEEERLEMVGDFLHFAGWKGIEIVELSNGKSGGAGAGAGGLQGFLASMGMNSRDPLWVVRAVKED